MKLFVYEPNTSKNEWICSSSIFVNYQKLAEKSIKTKFGSFAQDWSKKIIKKKKNVVCKITF